MRAVVHTHSLHATVLACAHKPIPAFHYMVAVAGGILRQINELGWDHHLSEVCTQQLEHLRAYDAQHPRLAALSDEFLAAKRKYGIAAA